MDVMLNVVGRVATTTLSAPTTMPMRDKCVGVARCSVSSGSRMRTTTTTTRNGKMSVVCATIVEQFVIISVMVSIMPATRVGCMLFVCDGDVVGVASFAGRQFRQRAASDLSGELVFCCPRCHRRHYYYYYYLIVK